MSDIDDLRARLVGKTIKSVEPLAKPEALFRITTDDGQITDLFATDLGWWVGPDTIRDGEVWSSHRSVGEMVWEMAGLDLDEELPLTVTSEWSGSRDIRVTVTGHEMTKERRDVYSDPFLHRFNHDEDAWMEHYKRLKAALPPGPPVTYRFMAELDPMDLRSDLLRGMEELPSTLEDWLSMAIRDDD